MLEVTPSSQVWTVTHIYGPELLQQLIDRKCSANECQQTAEFGRYQFTLQLTKCSAILEFVRAVLMIIQAF